MISFFLCTEVEKKIHAHFDRFASSRVRRKTRSPVGTWFGSLVPAFRVVLFSAESSRSLARARINERVMGSVIAHALSFAACIPRERAYS